jgi:dihydropteroate synthase
VLARVLALDHPADRQEVAERFGLDPRSLGAWTLQIGGLHPARAHRLVGVLREAGQTAAVAAADEGIDVLASGAWATLAAALATEPEVAEACATAVERMTATPGPLVARSLRLPLDGRPLVVGILNATPDSFYDRGRHFGLDRSIARAEAMVDEGADLIEVGGETLRPAVPPISVDEELARVVPVIEALRARLAHPIAVDTFKPAVAAAAVSAGAVLINDVSGLADERMAEVAAASGAALVVTHIQGRPKVANPRAQYRRVMDDVYAFLAARTARAHALGVPWESLVVDPGFSLGKQPAHDVAIVRRFRELRGLGLPIYLAPSRKNFIRDLLGLPVEELLEGTLAVVACGVLAGARIVRTHDVRATRRLVEMLSAILGPPPAVLPAETVSPGAVAEPGGGSRDA